MSGGIKKGEKIIIIVEGKGKNRAFLSHLRSKSVYTTHSHVFAVVRSGGRRSPGAKMVPRCAADLVQPQLVVGGAPTPACPDGWRERWMGWP